MSLNVAIVLFEDAEALDFAGPYEVFTTASRVARRRGAADDLFTVFSVAQRPEPVRLRAGLQVVPDFTFHQHPIIDVLIIRSLIGQAIASLHRYSSLTEHLLDQQ